MHYRLHSRLAPALAVAAIAGCASAGTTSSSAPATRAGGSASTTSAAITAADLRTRLYAYADDSMMGRKAGTPWNLKATDYIAGELKKMGMQPGGENGSYFQDV